MLLESIILPGGAANECRAGYCPNAAGFFPIEADGADVGLDSCDARFGFCAEHKHLAYTSPGAKVIVVPAMCAFPLSEGRKCRLRAEYPVARYGPARRCRPHIPPDAFARVTGQAPRQIKCEKAREGCTLQARWGPSVQDPPVRCTECKKPRDFWIQGHSRTKCANLSCSIELTSARNVWAPGPQTQMFFQETNLLSEKGWTDEEITARKLLYTHEHFGQRCQHCVQGHEYSFGKLTGWPYDGGQAPELGETAKQAREHKNWDSNMDRLGSGSLFEDSLTAAALTTLDILLTKAWFKLAYLRCFRRGSPRRAGERSWVLPSLEVFLKDKDRWAVLWNNVRAGEDLGGPRLFGLAEGQRVDALLVWTAAGRQLMRFLMENPTLVIPHLALEPGGPHHWCARNYARLGWEKAYQTVMFEFLADLERVHHLDRVKREALEADGVRLFELRTDRVQPGEVAAAGPAQGAPCSHLSCCFVPFMTNKVMYSIGLWKPEWNDQGNSCLHYNITQAPDQDEDKLEDKLPMHLSSLPENKDLDHPLKYPCGVCHSNLTCLTSMEWEKMGAAQRAQANFVLDPNSAASMVTRLTTVMHDESANPPLAAIEQAQRLLDSLKARLPQPPAVEVVGNDDDD